MKGRVQYIDVAKGMSIVMVAFSHSPLTLVFPDANDVMRLFRLPLFFFLSGVFLRVDVDWKKYMVKKADSILKPYLVTQCLMLVFAAVILSEIITLKDLAGILYGNGLTIRDVPTWYLTHLWAIFLAASLLVRFTPIETSRPVIKVSLIAALFAGGAFLIETFWGKTVGLGKLKAVLPGLPFSIDVLPVSLAFFMAGHFTRAGVKTFRPSLWLFVLVASVTWYVAIYTEAYINLNNRIFREPFLATLAAFVGIYMLFCLAYWFSKIELLRKIILPFSVATLFILIFHDPISTWALKAFKHYEVFENQDFAVALAFTLGVVLPIFIRKVVTQNTFLGFFYLPSPSVQSR